MNYITALPDFIEMQRISFCWFISEGLKDELNNFSSILDFSGNIEYIFFGQEYKLVKPIYNSSNAKKHAANYIAQLIMPIEMRNRQTNTTIRQGRLSIANLPLMTNSATFIINGCERIIVSQVIRSPGVYFEKNKKQKRRKLNKIILSNDFHKVRSFTQTSFGILRNPKFLPLISNSKNLLQNSVDSKSTTEFLNFIEFFKLYTIVSKTLNNEIKSQRSRNFLKLLKFINTDDISGIDQQNKKNIIILHQLNSLLKNIIQYKILQTFFIEKKVKTNNQTFSIRQYENKQIQFLYKKKIKRVNFLLKQKILSFEKLTQTLEKQTYIEFLNNSKNFYKLSHNEIDLKYFQVLKQKINKYNTIIAQYKNKTYKLLNDNSTLIFNNRLNKTRNFSFLKTKINRNINILKEVKIVFEERKKLKPVVYFPIIKNYKRNDILKNKDYFEKKDIYKQKYEGKDLYTATLIPEYGSWIRFGFLRNKKIDMYKYPITNRYEDDIVIQIDKIIKKPVTHLLREMGLKDLEISKNLEHSDYFYFNNPFLTASFDSNNPLLRFNIDDTYKNISEFSRIFDARYYRLGKIGRHKLNQRLDLKISQEFSSIIYDDIFAIIDYLITMSITKGGSDDIDHLKNRRVRSIGELIQQLFRIGFQRLSRKILSQVYKAESPLILTSNVISTTVREFFGSSQLSQYMDQTNPLASLTHKRRISGLGPGGFDRDRISFSVRDIHPSHYGRICPIETPEGKNVGLISSLTTCARVNDSGFLETPFWRVINGKVIKTKNPIYLTADIEDLYKIAPADISTNQENYLTKSSIPVRYKQDFITVNPSEIDFIAISTVQVVSVAASLIPFFEHDDANRALMGSNMQRQSVPLLIPQRPIIGTGLENQIAADSGITINALKSGIVDFVSSKKIIVKSESGRKFKYRLQKYQRSNQETCINQRPIVWKGEKVKSGQILADGPSMNGGELALGQNILVAYMPWHGYNFEDAILINERLVYEDIFTSIHIERYEIKVNLTNDNREQTTNNIPNLNASHTQNLNEDGIIAIGTFVKPGDILLGKVTTKDDSDQLPEAKLIRAIFGAKSKGVRDSSFKMPDGEFGRVLRIIIFRQKNKLASEFEKIQVFIAQIRKIQVGDKIAGRHGNKGIISRILPRQDMPFLPDGTPIDILLNPLGVPSRMNVGQLYECLLGLAGNKLNRRFKILPFDELYGQEVSRILINKKLREASLEKNEAWLFNPYCPGKIVLVDGRTGKEFENPITVGNAYILKLIHLVDDKMHARATGPYSLVTQQPLGGKARHGGQRFGEMEVWALEGFGAAYTLKEILTIKSDDMQGRNDTLDAIVKGQIIPTSGIPESFKVLLQELRAIGLDISTYKLEKFSSNQTYEIEVNLMENYDPMSKTFSPTSNINNILF
uniref:DNA-directed RNA polymerase subunit beta n=1 Tax=Rhizosolenia imbricata TaxID=216768 RepID=A0A089VMX1_9STRA|nr:RNA polymerase beta subunit [Rhizosolenia imbricata]AIR75715.1 RNA polymerase beta subunit [Rhizosolenia imbricata]